MQLIRAKATGVGRFSQKTQKKEETLLRRDQDKFYTHPMTIDQDDRRPIIAQYVEDGEDKRRRDSTASHARWVRFSLAFLSTKSYETW